MDYLQSLSRQILDFFVKGGPVMYPIFILSVVGLAIAIERWKIIRKKKGNIKEFLKKIKPLLMENNISDAIDICKTENTSIAKVTRLILENEDITNRDSLEKAAENAIISEMPELERRIGILGIIATIEPLLGLLGTVTGMIKAFFVISNISMSDPAQLANGIAEALYTTAAGLIVGIPAIAVYNYLMIKVEAISLDMEQTAGKVITFLTIRK